MLADIAAGRTDPIETFIHNSPRYKETMFIKEVLLKMQQTRTHMALVTDVDGTTIGLVTMEDEDNGIVYSI